MNLITDHGPLGSGIIKRQYIVLYTWNISDDRCIITIVPSRVYI